LGNLSIADKLNQLVRSGTLPVLTFPSAEVGVASPAQSITLANTGTASITVSTITSGTRFITTVGGSCPALPITLTAGGSCTENIEFLPVAAGLVNGSIIFSGTGVVPQSILLTGSGTQAPTTITLIASVNPALAGQPVIYTAIVGTNGLGTPTGTVAFDASGVAFATQALAPASATTLATAPSLPTGTANITVVYSGDSNFTSSTSTTLPQVIEDFSIMPVPNNSASSTSQTVVPGKAATFSFTLTPLLGPFNFPVVLTAAGLPPGATVTFSPQTATPGASPASFTMTVQTALAQGFLHHGHTWGSGSMVFAFLLLPFTYKLRRYTGQGKILRRMTLAVTLLLCLAGLGSITGCGADTGFFAESQQNYIIAVTGTATGSNGYALQHSTSVTLSVQ
jgi:Bacterial Ig-like domain (group 3)